MNENNFSLDISAEQKIFNFALPSTSNELDSNSSNINIQKEDLSLPESTSFTSQSNTPLPQSAVIQVQAQPQLPNVNYITSSSSPLPQSAAIPSLPSIALPQPSLVEIQPEVELPKPNIIPSTVPSKTTPPIPEIAKTNVGLSVKFDARDGYNRLNQKISSLEEDVRNTNLKDLSSWLPYPKARNNFEEKPSTDPTNLVFNNRTDKFFDTPQWA